MSYLSGKLSMQEYQRIRALPSMLHVEIIGRESKLYGWLIDIMHNALLFYLYSALREYNRSSIRECTPLQGNKG